jgi:hypothetical protein
MATASMIELVWRNPAYEKGLQQHGALFGGFKSEVNSDYESGRPGKKTRTEYKKFDRQFVYPGFIEDSTSAYHIGNSEGWDPACASAAGSVPPDLQMPRAVLTSSHREHATPAGKKDLSTQIANLPKRAQSTMSYARVLDELPDQEGGFANIVMMSDLSHPTNPKQPSHAQNGTPFNPHTFDIDDVRHNSHLMDAGRQLPSRTTAEMDSWGADPHCKIRRVLRQGVPNATKSGLAELEDGTELQQASSEAVVEFVDDVEWHNSGSTMLDMHLDSHVGGSQATLKKIVLQFSKEDHQISEVVIDLSDILRSQGSINGASAGRPAELSAKQKPEITILCDGKKRMQEVYYDTSVGLFTTNKFKFGVSKVRYFPPLVGTTGGFDNGSHVATITPTFGGLQPTTEASVATSQNSTSGAVGTAAEKLVTNPTNRSTSAQACSPFYAQVILPTDTGAGVYDGRNTNVRAIPFNETSIGTLEAEENRMKSKPTPEQVLFDNCDHLSRNLHFPHEAPTKEGNAKIVAYNAAGTPVDSTLDPYNTTRIIQTGSNVEDATFDPARAAPQMTRFFDKSLQMAIANNAAVNRGCSLTAKPTYTSFTVAPRKTNGTLLAVNVTLESRAV